MDMPKCIDIEKVILSSYMQNRDCMLENITKILPEMFYLDIHKTICKTMYDSLNNDFTILCETHPTYTTEIADVYSSRSIASNLTAMADILIDRYNRRKIIISAQNALQACLNEYDKKAVEISEKLKTDIKIDYQDKPKPEQIIDIYPRLLDFMEETMQGEGLKTGLLDLDNKMGIMLPGEYVILAGRPSMGKTSLAMCIARYMAKNNSPVLVFSLETTKEVICGRVIFGDCDCSYDKILRGDKSEMYKAKESVSNIINVPIYVDDCCGVTMSHMESVSEKFVRDFGVKVIMIDHVGLIKSTSKGNDHEKLSEISKNIKAMLKSTQTTGIILCQLSREVEKRSPPMPMLSDLRASGSLEEDADKVIFVYREEYYNKKSERKGVADIIVSKNKNGRTGFTEAVFDGETMNFRNYSKGSLNGQKEVW